MQLEVDGESCYVYDGKRPWRAGRPALVFVHGAAMDHSVWLLQSRYFAHHGYNVLAVDLPGHGRSGGAPRPSVAELADWLARLLDAAETPRATLIGHSMGALAALETAARHPQRVARLVLLGVSTPMPVAEALLDAARDDVAAAAAMITHWGHAPDAHFGGHPVPGLWLPGNTRRLLLRAAPGVLHTDLNACHEYRDGLDSAAAVAIPVLCLIGQHDRMTPPRATRPLLDALADKVQAHTLSRCGHMIMLERPDQTLDALIDFAAETG